jgi:hypothetical protein
VTDPLDRVDIGNAAAVMRAEWRADEEEWTRAALERWQHDRTLLEVLRECMHRGDTIAVRSGSVTFTGRVEAVGDNVVAIAARDGRVDLCCDAAVPLVVRVVERARSGGTRGDAVTTFRARLLELEMAEGDVEAGTRVSGDVVRGRLTVGHDHVVVRDDEAGDGGGGEMVIALAALAWVRPAPLFTG